jgi:hypothetical protein
MTTIVVQRLQPATQRGQQSEVRAITGFIFLLYLIGPGLGTRSYLVRGDSHEARASKTEE